MVLPFLGGARLHAGPGSSKQACGRVVEHISSVPSQAIPREGPWCDSCVHCGCCYKGPDLQQEGFQLNNSHIVLQEAAQSAAQPVLPEWAERYCPGPAWSLCPFSAGTPRRSGFFYSKGFKTRASQQSLLLVPRYLSCPPSLHVSGNTASQRQDHTYRSLTVRCGYSTKFWPTVQEEMTLTASGNNPEREAVRPSPFHPPT